MSTYKPILSLPVFCLLAFFLGCLSNQDKPRTWSEEEIQNVLENKDPNRKTKRGEPALHYAIRQKNIDTVTTLLKAGAKIDLKNRDHETPLYYAIKKRQWTPIPFDMIKLLIDKGADIHSKNSMKSNMFLPATQRKDTPLHIAARSGQPDVVSLLLQHKANPNIKNTYDRTPLHASQSAEITEALLANGANPNIRDMRGDSPVFMATSVPQLNLLIDANADLQSPGHNNKSVLNHFISSNNPEAVELLLSRGVDPAIRTSHTEWTPLHLAAQHSLPSLKRIIKHSAGIDIDIKDERGQTPLLFGIANSSEPVKLAKFLIESGADVRAKDKWGVTALHLAALIGNAGLADILIRNKAAINAQDYCGLTPLHYCAMKEIHNYKNRSSLVNTETYRKRLATAKVLLQKGAQSHIKDNQGDTPLSLAGKNEFNEFILIFREHGRHQ